MINFLRDKNNLKYNVYMQEEEPEEKNGLWFKSNTLNFNSVVFTTVNKIKGRYNTDLKNIPIEFFWGICILIDDSIYLIGGYDNKKTYKYDIINDEYKELQTSPVGFTMSVAATIGKNIFIFGGWSGNSSYPTRTYKYDTQENIYTRLSNIPYSLRNGSAVAVGTDIYLFGSEDENNTKYAYKYDTLNDSYIKLNNLPYNFHRGSAVYYNQNIYLFGGGASLRSILKYNINNDTYTLLSTTLPFDFSGGGIAKVDSHFVYLIGGEASSGKDVYKYDLLQEEFIKLENLPNTFTCNPIVSWRDCLYLIGGAGNNNKIQIMNLKLDVFPKNSIIITQRQNKYFSKIIDFKNIETFFNDALYHTQNGELINNIPTYYGDGEKWIKFKN